MRQWTFEQLSQTDPQNPYSPLQPGDTVEYEGEIYTWNGRDFGDVDGDGQPDSTLTNIAAQAGAVMMGTALGTSNALNRQTGDSNFAARQRASADASREQQARMQVDAQRGYQLGSRDPRVEGDKDAATRAAAEYGQKMAQISGAAGGGAAALASMNVKDPSASYAEHRQRADAQHLVGTQHQTAAERAQQHVIAKEAEADEANRVDQNESRHNRLSSYLSNIGPDGFPRVNDEPAQRTTVTEESPVTEQQQDIIKERVIRAASDVPDESKKADLERQGMEAIKAYYADPPDRSLWEQFRKDVAAAGGTTVNADPGLSIMSDGSVKFDSTGSRAQAQARSQLQ